MQAIVALDVVGSNPDMGNFVALLPVHLIHYNKQTLNQISSHFYQIDVRESSFDLISMLAGNNKYSSNVCCVVRTLSRVL